MTVPTKINFAFHALLQALSGIQDIGIRRVYIPITFPDYLQS